jgi:serine/threonine protein kinase
VSCLQHSREDASFVGRTRDNVSVVVRLAKPGSEQVEREIWGLGRCQGMTRVPRLLYGGGAVIDNVPLRVSVREFIAGETLCNSRHQLDALESKLSEALVQIHDRGVVHRDIKPANIIVDYHGEPWIIDFGCSGSIGGDAGKGTPGYVSNRAAKGLPARPQDDDYSLRKSLQKVRKVSQRSATGTFYE